MNTICYKEAKLKLPAKYYVSGDRFQKSSMIWKKLPPKCELYEISYLPRTDVCCSLKMWVFGNFPLYFSLLTANLNIEQQY